MFNSIAEGIGRHKKIIPAVVALAAIAAYVIPANSLALGAAISGSGNVVQTQTQSNSISATNSGKYGGAFADFNFQLNDASNTADVSVTNDPGHNKIIDSGNVLQSIDQSNSISADNSGDFGTASASHNTQVNSASNDASVNVSNDPSGGNYHHHHHHDKISNSGNVIQSIDQSNSISASNSGASGTATADDNTQVNDAHNHADVNVSNDPSGGSHHHHSGDKIKDSGNVVQSISQSNSDSASNSGDHGTASASHNTQVNSASNDAHVNVSNK
jgi:hypothetical protein